MVKHSVLKKNAFTMIELIFAIVIIAISVVSLPMMIQTTNKGIENNIIQEAIFASSAILNEATTFYWDKNSLHDGNITGGYTRVINTGNCSTTLPSKRPGHINRQCLNDHNITLFDSGSYNASYDYNQSVESVAQFYNNTSILSGIGTTAASYKHYYSASATITHCGTGGCVIFGENNSSIQDDIKQIEIKITETGSTIPIVLLRAYTTNIGEVKPQSRIF